MNTYDWKKTDISDFRNLIGRGKSFRVKLTKFLSKLIPSRVGVANTGLTGVEVVGLVAVFTLATFGALAAYAISEGYTVRRVKGSEVWEFLAP